MIQARIHSAATRFLMRERIDHTLQPTALVNETYLKLRRMLHEEERTGAQVVGGAVDAMWRILVDHAKARLRHKRGGTHNTVRLDTSFPLQARNHQDQGWLAIAEAVDRLRRVQPRQAEIFLLHHFLGLSMCEVADQLGISKRTADREWALLKAWLRRELGNGAEEYVS